MESQFYVANSATDTILFGRQLENGMRVLIEDSLLRGPDRDTDNPYDIARRDENNQWCEVTNLQGNFNTTMFVGKYDDGTLRIRRFSPSWAWIVKLDSIPE